MLPIESWRVYYADGSSFSSADGTWVQAPPFGIQLVVYYHVPPYKTIDNGGDDGIFTWLGEETHSDYAGIKMGLWMDREGFYRVQDLAYQSTMPTMPEVK